MDNNIFILNLDPNLDSWNTNPQGFTNNKEVKPFIFPFDGENMICKLIFDNVNINIITN